MKKYTNNLISDNANTGMEVAEKLLDALFDVLIQSGVHLVRKLWMTVDITEVHTNKKL